MSDLGTLLGNGRYVFFNSLASNPIPAYREAYSIAKERIQGTSVLLGGRDLNNNKVESPEMEQFNARITSFLGQIKSIAATMRANEIAYIQGLASQYEHDNKDKLLSKNEKKSLKDLLNGKITVNDYDNLIIALNKVKYSDKKEEFAKTVKTQLNNMAILDANFKAASKQDQEKISTAYVEKYGQYANAYASLVTRAKTVQMKIAGETVTEFARMQRVNLDALADKINGTLEILSENEELNNYIKEEYKKHLSDTDFEIVKNNFISHIIDSIIEQVRKNPSQQNRTTAKQISSKIITALSSDKSLRDLSSNSQASKITFQKKQTSQSEMLLKSLMGGKGSKNVVNLLLEMENMEEILRDLIPDKASEYISQLETLKRNIEQATDNMEKALDKDKRELSKNIRNDFRSSDLGKDLAAIIDSNNGKFDINIILQKQTNAFLDQTKNELYNLAIRVKKSSLAELVASEIARRGPEKALGSNIGGGLNLKDDILYVVRVHKVKAPTDSEISSELQKALEDINAALNEVINTYLERYYNRDKNSEYKNEQKGTTNTQKAREDYEATMRQLLQRIQTIYNKLDSTVQKELDKYAESTDTFLGSISVKEYSLYQDSIGYHGGTLGPSALKAVENIQKMYDIGGISKLDMDNLTFALMNTSNNTIGGAPLRTSLEQYLLAGAALMMFDEGYGEAIPYLNKMEDSIRQLMPKNLNLYQLNQAYVPASFLLETIYQNLNEFYHKECQECVTNFKNRNKVVITNNANEQATWYGKDPQDMFEKTSANVLANIDIQFIFMAGMMDIFSNLTNAFKPKG